MAVSVFFPGGLGIFPAPRLPDKPGSAGEGAIHRIARRTR